MMSFRCSKRLLLAALTVVLTFAFSVSPGALSAHTSAAPPQFNSRVSGKVTDAEGNPLVGVKVVITMVLQDPDRPFEPVEMITGDDGVYFARNVRTAHARITANLEGYEPFTMERELRGGPNRIDIVLQPPEIPEEVIRATAASEAYGLGVAAYNAGNYEEAIGHMEEARSNIDDNEQNSDALAAIAQNIAGSYLALAKYEEAVAAIQEWLRHAPNSADARLALSQAYTELGDEEAAATEMEAALATGAEDPESHYNMGMMMVDSGDVEGGIAEMEMAVQLRPVFPLAHKNLGYVYARTQEYQKAIDHFELFLEQDPDSPDAADVQQFIDALKSMIG
jgi:tetratricopeptide (TPR) repeat protein